MNGTEFYEFLRNHFSVIGMQLNGNNVFNKWLFKKSSQTFSFQFTVINNGNKSISKEVIIASWNANVPITNKWLIENISINYHRDCRLGVLKYLINTFEYLR